MIRLTTDSQTGIWPYNKILLFMVTIINIVSLFQPIPAYCRLFQSIPAYSSQFQPIPAYFSLIQPIPPHSSPFQRIPVYSSLFHPIPIPIHIPAYSSPG